MMLLLFLFDFSKNIRLTLFWLRDDNLTGFTNKKHNGAVSDMVQQTIQRLICLL